MYRKSLLQIWISLLVIVLILTACVSAEPEETQIPPTEPLSPPTATVVQPTEAAPPEDSATQTVPPTVEPPAEEEVAPAYPKYDIGEGILDFAVADLNGDALPDIAVPDNINGLTTILMNDGQGAFQETAIYDTGESSTGVTAADLNGDSYIDLAISQQVPETISILINEGAGTFQTPVFYAGTNTKHVQSGDMNGDSFIDLVVVKAPDLVGLLFNNGNGTFGDIVTYFVGPGTGYGFAYPVDVDGDDDLDVAVRHFPDALVSILMNQGDGTLGEPSEYEVCFSPRLSTFVHPWLTSGDLNQDDAPDLLAPCDSGIVSILLNHGDGSFQEAIHLETGGRTKDVQLTELNGDDLPDLLVAPTGTGLMSSYANLGDGTFQPLKDYPYTDYGIYEIEKLSIIDVEGNGLLDVIALNGGSTVYVFPIEGDG